MKSVATITLHKVRNYGSVLQTYATQKFFEDEGMEAFIIDYCSPRFVESNRIEDEYKRFRFKYKNPFVKLLFKAIMVPSLKQQRIVFDGFLRDNVRFSDRKYYSAQELKNNPPKADVYCTGSDQVWNSRTNGFIETPFYLDFGSVSVRRIAFSASFGRSELPEEEVKVIIPFLRAYRGIGVRESSGLKLLADMGVVNSANTLDPTLAIEPDIWYKKVEESTLPDGDYILIYEFGREGNIEQYAQELSKRTGLPIVRICYWHHKKVKGETNIVLPTVPQFLGLIKNAQYVVTNSFHACVFSTVFKRKLLVVYPSHFSVRLENYLRMTGMEQCHVNSMNELDLFISDFGVDYEKVWKQLDELREKTKNYMRSLICSGE